MYYFDFCVVLGSGIAQWYSDGPEYLQPELRAPAPPKTKSSVVLPSSEHSGALCFATVFWQERPIPCRGLKAICCLKAMELGCEVVYFYE